MDDLQILLQSWVTSRGELNQFKLVRNGVVFRHDSQFRTVRAVMDTIAEAEASGTLLYLNQGKFW